MVEYVEAEEKAVEVGAITEHVVLVGQLAPCTRGVLAGEPVGNQQAGVALVGGIPRQAAPGHVAVREGQQTAFDSEVAAEVGEKQGPAVAVKARKSHQLTLRQPCLRECDERQKPPHRSLAEVILDAMKHPLKKLVDAVGRQIVVYALVEPFMAAEAHKLVDKYTQHERVLRLRVTYYALHLSVGQPLAVQTQVIGD